VPNYSFKSDESFLEKIAIGAVGTNQVFTDLQLQGHQPLELERGSKSYKIWKTIKIKRIRVPDILCVACGRRVESRAKTTLELSMSHSTSDPTRTWDYGLDDEDYVALVVCHKIGDKPIDVQAEELVQYASVYELRTAESNGAVVFVQPKGAEEGFEARVRWPASIARDAGIISSITPERVQYKRLSDNHTITASLVRGSFTLRPLVSVGQHIVTNQIIGAVVPIARTFSCSPKVTEEYYLGLLQNPSHSKRYAAAKALAFFPSEKVAQELREKVAQIDEHIYIRLEAAAALAKQGDTAGTDFIKSCLIDQLLQPKLEAVIIMSEVRSEITDQLLIETLYDETQHPEIRAGAAWALGELRNKAAMTALIDSFVAINEELRIEAARALAKLAAQFTPEITHHLSQSTPAKRPGIAWALSKSGKFMVQDMLNALVDEDARQWVAYILGTQDQQRWVHEIEQLRAKDTEVYFAVTVLWKVITSWIYGLEEY
jgi:hypothetical protein